MASINDYFSKAGDGNTSYPVVASVTQAREAGDSVLVCQNLAGWSTTTPVHFSTYKKSASGEVVPSSQTDWKGIVSGNTITQMVRICGANDSGNSIGDAVELNPTIGWLRDLIEGVLVSLNQNGTIKSSVVGTAQLTSNAVTSIKIADGAVSASKLSWSSIVDKIYPIGSIYMSVKNVSPASFIGGTWTAWGGGRVPVGIGNNGTTNYSTVEATGGTDKVTLTTAQMPSHAHYPNDWLVVANKNYVAHGDKIATNQNGGISTIKNALPNDDGYISKSTGGGGSHENRQPYITCYMWKRTA